MSNDIVVARSQHYATNVQLLLQQKKSRFRKAVMEDSYKGKAAKAVEQFGAVSAVKRTTRHGDTPLIETPHDARWVYPHHYEWADLIDDQDKLEMLIDPTSPYAENGAAALNRAMDDEIVAAFFADARTGEDGATSTSFPAGQAIAADVGAGSATGMNIAKLRAAKKLLLAAEVDVENDPLYVAISAEQHDDLLNETQATSLDFNTRPVLVDGRITQFMGFNFIDSERLGVNGSAQRRCPAWAKSGMHLGIWNDVTGKITERGDKAFATQVYAKGTFGATRLEEKKVVEIICSES